MGTFAVQMAKCHGAEVTAVDSEQKLEMLRAIGADHVIDYAQEDCTKGVERYDLSRYGRSPVDLRLQARNGPRWPVRAVRGLKIRHIPGDATGPLVSIASKKKMGINPMKVDNEEDLRFLLELHEKGSISPVIDRRCLLSEVPEALRDLSKGLLV